MVKVPSDRPIFATMSDFYERDLRPYLTASEAERRDAVFFAAGLGFAAFAVAFCIMMIMSRTLGTVHFVLPGMLGVGLGSFIINRTRNKITDSFLGKIASELGFKYNRKPSTALEFDQFKRLKFFGSFHESEWEDEIVGTHADTDFTVYEAHLTERRGKNRTKHTVFHGQLLVINYPRDFFGETVLRRDRGMLNRFGKPAKGFTQVGLASPKFEKAYEAWSTDQVEARFLLDPLVLERFQALEDLFGGANLQAAFTRGKLLISLASGDRLSMGSMFSTLDDQKRVELVLAELDTIFDLIDLAVKPIDGTITEPISLQAVKSA